MSLPESTASRRQFMARCGGALACVAAPSAVALQAVATDRFAILNDTHVAAGHPASASIPTRLREAVDWLLEQEQRPAAVILNGDLALNDGRPGDYAHLARLIAPLHAVGLPVHYTLGNHDNRDVFHEVLQPRSPNQAPVLGKHVGMVPLPKANLFLLDSLKAPMTSSGLLGAEQLAWLGRQLDEHADKPALIVAHHHPRLAGDDKYYANGLEDTDSLWELLVSKPHVKAYLHGHLHQRNFTQHHGIHIVDTPATGFVRRQETSTTGWTLVQLTDHGAQFATLTHQRDHPWNGAVQPLTWR